jgi:hypothetical protein
VLVLRRTETIGWKNKAGDFVLLKIDVGWKFDILGYAVRLSHLDGCTVEANENETD